MALRLDESMNMSEEMRFRKRNKKIRKELEKKVHFNSNELERIMLIYYHLQKENKDRKKQIQKTQFKDVLHCGFDMTDSAFNERVVTALESGSMVSGNLVSIEVWAKTFSLFLRGSLKEKISHCFKVYDQTGEGFLVKDILFNCLKGSLISAVSDDDADEAVRDMLELLVKKMDLDRDNKISFNDYKQTVQKEPMLLETFGQCIPSRIAVHTIASTVLLKLENV